MSKTNEEKLESAENKLGHKEIINQFNFLQGRILTIVEAIMADDSRQKATKDLIKDAFRNQMDYVTIECFPELPIQPTSAIESSHGESIEDITDGAMLETFIENAIK